MVEVKHLNDEAYEIDLSTKTEDRVDVLSQVKNIQPQYQFDEVNAVKDISQV